MATLDDLRKRTLAFYALIVGDASSDRRLYVKRGNPVKLGDKGLVGIFDDTLTRVTNPVFAFSPSFDVAITFEGVWALDQKNFEGLFKESEAVLAKTGEWIEALSTALPIADEGKEEFGLRLRQNSLLRRKIQSVLRSPHLSTLTVAKLKRRMISRGLDPSRLVSDGKLIFNRETERDLLQLLNEDLFTGDFSGEQYAAGRKAKRVEPKTS
jgi:hypothetical protein